MKKVILLLIFVLVSAIFIPATYAEIINVEGTGSYLVGDGPDENIKVAKELARKEALRNASETSGVYVQSYSEAKNNILTDDEIVTVSAALLQITDEQCEPVVIDKKYVQYVYRIKAKVDTDTINQQIKNVLRSKENFNKTVALEQKINELARENARLKQEYNKTKNQSLKNSYQKQITTNQKALATNFRYTDRMPVYEMTIGGISFGCTLGYVKSIYGEPDEIKTFNSDGVKGFNYYYGKNFRVCGRIFNRDNKVEDDYPVVGVTIKDNSLTMPCGIKVGEPYSKVIDKFGIGAKYNVYNNPQLTGYSYLLKATLQEIHFQVDGNGIIREIGTGTDW